MLVTHPNKQSNNKSKSETPTPHRITSLSIANLFHWAFCFAGQLSRMQIIEGICLIRWLNQILHFNGNYSASENNSSYRMLVDSPGLPRPKPKVTESRAWQAICPRCSLVCEHTITGYIGNLVKKRCCGCGTKCSGSQISHPSICEGFYIRQIVRESMGLRLRITFTRTPTRQNSKPPRSRSATRQLIDVLMSIHLYRNYVLEFDTSIGHLVIEEGAILNCLRLEYVLKRGS
jgi:hypothetical protein